MIIIIQINDNNLLIKSNGVLGFSQGYAWFNDGQVCFDIDPQYSAVKHSRLFPQQINNHYWQQCDQTPVAKNDCHIRHAADLVWQHLQALKQKYKFRDVIFCVPSHYQTANLQLLLGVAKTCNLNVVGLLNSAVLALRDQVTAKGDYLHIDMQLHQAVCSTVSMKKGQLILSDVEIVHEVGLLAMQDVILKTIQHNFIQNDRFDPLHHAQTEQQLFDQLPEVINKLVQFGKTSVSIDYQSQQHTANVEARQLITAIKPLYTSLLKARASKTYQHIFYQPNGVEPLNLMLGENISVLSDSLKYSVEELLGLTYKDSDVSAENEISYVTQCIVSGSNNKSKKVASKKTKKALNDRAGTSSSSLKIGDDVTHLLQSGIAIPLAKAFIETDKNDLLLISKSSNIKELLEQGSIFIINDEKRKILQPNDRLASNLADGVVSAIQVENDG